MMNINKLWWMQFIQMRWSHKRVHLRVCWSLFVLAVLISFKYTFFSWPSLLIVSELAAGGNIWIWYPNIPPSCHFSMEDFLTSPNSSPPSVLPLELWNLACWPSQGTGLTSIPQLVLLRSRPQKHFFSPGLERSQFSPSFFFQAPTNLDIISYPLYQGPRGTQQVLK